jgi:hypothetical protein
MSWTSDKDERAALMKAMMYDTEEISNNALLHCAAAYSDSGTILELLNRGVDIMNEDLHHRLPLEKAIGNKNSKFLFTVVTKQCFIFLQTRLYLNLNVTHTVYEYKFKVACHGGFPRKLVSF